MRLRFGIVLSVLSTALLAQEPTQVVVLEPAPRAPTDFWTEPKAPCPPGPDRPAGAAAAGLCTPSARAREGQPHGPTDAVPVRKDLAEPYRAVWPEWARHWRERAPEILAELDRLRLGALRDTASACGHFATWLGELRVAIPPGPDRQFLELHRALYELHSLCSAPKKRPNVILAATDAAETAVREVSGWAAGRSAYYASSVRAERATARRRVSTPVAETPAERTRLVEEDRSPQIAERERDVRRDQDDRDVPKSRRSCERWVHSWSRLEAVCADGKRARQGRY